MNYFQNLRSLKDFVSNYKPLPDMRISEVNILLVGQINAGKSSFFNTLNSIFRGEISSRACAGTSTHSLTTTVRVIFCRSLHAYEIHFPSLCSYQHNAFYNFVSNSLVGENILMIIVSS